MYLTPFFPVLYKIFPSPSVYVYKSILMFIVNLLTGFSKWKMAGGWAGGYQNGKLFRNG